jgi:hypothetical protein
MIFSNELGAYREWKFGRSRRPTIDWKRYRTTWQTPRNPNAVGRTFASAGGGTTTGLPLYSGGRRMKPVRDEFGNFIGWNLADSDDADYYEMDEGLGFQNDQAWTNAMRPTSQGSSRFEQITGLIGRGLDIYQQRRQQPPQFVPAPTAPGGGFGTPSASIGLSTATGLQGGLNISPTTLIIGGVAVALLLMKRK